MIRKHVTLTLLSVSSMTMLIVNNVIQLITYQKARKSVILIFPIVLLIKKTIVTLANQLTIDQLITRLVGVISTIVKPTHNKNATPVKTLSTSPKLP